MNRISYFYKIIAGGTVLFILFMLCTLTGCSKSDEPNGGNDNRSGPPYKFRVEVSAEKSDEYKILLNVGNYNYVDENKWPRTEWLFDLDNQQTVSSPWIQEYEIPRNFNKFGMLLNLSAIEITPFEEELQQIISGKLFVNNKLLAEWSNKFAWHFSITYLTQSKEYKVSTSDGKSFETNKID